MAAAAHTTLEYPESVWQPLAATYIRFQGGNGGCHTLLLNTPKVSGRGGCGR
jgi:hypothetical protein